MPAPTRGAYLRKLAALVREHEDELVKILMLEQGKIHALAKTEIEFSADYFDYMANAARVYSGDVMQSDNENENIIIARQPIGVAVGIIAWNFPFFLIARKMGPALVTGNTIVIKPSSDTPGLALAFAKLVDEVGLPAGVANFVSGRGSIIGDDLAKNPKVGIISLTGSTASGKKVMAAAANHVAKMSLELGGKAPAIVAKDADIDLAVQAILTRELITMGKFVTTLNGFMCKKMLRMSLLRK